VIPRNASIAIDSLGTRQASDVGGGINGYHIDVFYGTRRRECRSSGHPHSGVDLLHY
jgi:3D (Asp-Asp-Asp) domain-containing protein